MPPPLTLLRARAVAPIVRPPLDDGAVLIDRDRIAAVAPYPELRRQSPSSKTVDLGDAVILPGLINAHCHLDYTDMSGLPSPRYFSDWIKSLLCLKAGASYTDYAAAWLRGAQMLLRNGVTAVGDIEAVPELLPEVWSSTPLRVLSFLEMTGVKSRRDPADILREVTAKIETLQPGHSCYGLSPHALYSTSPALLEATARAARNHGWRVAMHLAESAEEAEMYATASGPLFQWLRSQRDMSDCGGISCVQQAARCGLLGENFLAIHANYVSAEDVGLLGASGASVVHCPRSHAYFGHAPFPYGDFANAGVSVCLGTDSLASVIKTADAPLELSLFPEMRLFAARHPEASPADILQMVTTNAARALGRAGEMGQISAGALADLTVLPLPGGAPDVSEAIAQHTGPAAAVMIDGQWATAPSCLREQ